MNYCQIHKYPHKIIDTYKDYLLPFDQHITSYDTKSNTYSKFIKHLEDEIVDDMDSWKGLSISRTMCHLSGNIDELHVYAHQNHFRLDSSYG